MRVFISAGEPSGDAHGAAVVRAFRWKGAAVEFEGVGGDEMAGAGVSLLHTVDQLSAMGLVEAVRALPAHWRLFAQIRRRLVAGEYDLAILIDYPGFHLRVAAAASALGVPVLYYIAPQLWAWGKWRLRALRKHVRRLAVVLPFEEPFFRGHGVDATFVGHPLVDRGTPLPLHQARRALGVGNDSRVLGLFPGSRSQEIRRLWPRFRDAALLLRRSTPELTTVVAATARASYPGADDCVLWRGDPGVVFAAADAALCKSGTTTLEAALSGTPMVIAYRMHALTYSVARRLVRLPHVGLVNLVASRDVAPEFLQRAATPRALADAVRPLLDRAGIGARTQRSAFGEIRAKLGVPGVGGRVVDLALELVA